MPSLADLFPDENFRFHLTLRRGEPREFFRRQDSSGRLIAERKRWLAAEPSRYSALLPDGEAHLTEFIELCRAWDVLESQETREIGLESAPAGMALKKVGGLLEPDFVFLAADADGNFRMRGGVVCFPSGWALQEKMGHTLEFIHGVVPGLNPLLSSPINQFLSKLKPGVAYQRDNWGIAATDELNQHPLRHLPAPEPPVEFDQLWLRVEYQVLIALPRSKGVLFGIRIVNHRLDSLLHDSGVVRGLTRALVSMPDSVAVYKRLETVRAPLVQALKFVT